MTTRIGQQERRGLGLPGLGIGVALLAGGCSASKPSTFQGGEDAAGQADIGAAPAALVVPELSESTLTAQWQQLANPGLGGDGTVFSTPFGWFSLSLRDYAFDGKAPGNYESYLYHSLDGVNWRVVPLPHLGPEASFNNLFLRHLAYGSGMLVVGGSVSFNQDIVLVSHDGDHVRPITIDGDPPTGFHTMAYEGDRFFALATAEAYTSLDGMIWQRAALDSPFLPNGVAYGNSTFLIAGNDGLALSADGEAWQHVEIDCSVGGACSPDPGGNIHHIMQSAWFSEDHFYSRSVDSTWLRSVDGITWEDTSGLIPFARLGEYEVGSDDGAVVVVPPEPKIAAWKPGTDPVYLDLHSFPEDAAGHSTNPGVLADMGTLLAPSPVPETVSFPLDSGQDCTTTACIVLSGRLYMAQ
jgi:hypothetical protein